MKAYDVVGYAFEADILCLDCMGERADACALNLADADACTEAECAPVFAGDEGALAETCGNCHCTLGD